MSWKWSGEMNKCIYYVEGPCEQQLIAALKETPGKLIPGKVKVFNVVQNLISEVADAFYSGGDNCSAGI